MLEGGVEGWKRCETLKRCNMKGDSVGDIAFGGDVVEVVVEKTKQKRCSNDTTIIDTKTKI